MSEEYTMMNTMMVLCLALVYCLCGLLYGLVYVLTFKPEAQNAVIGLQVLFWPAMIVLEIILAVAAQFGAVTAAIAERMKTGSKRTARPRGGVVGR